MSDIIAALQQVLGAIWFTMMENDYLPGTHISLQDIYLFTWIALILVEFFRTMIFINIEESLDDD